MTQATISDERLAELMSHLEGADSAELKLTVPERDIRSVADALDLDILDAEIRQVVFFDTPELTLNAAGLVVRARRLQGGAGDTVVKLRPIVPTELPEDLRRSGSVAIEVDAVPGGFVCSASMKGKATAEEVREVIRGEEPIPGLFSKEQRRFYKAHAPEGVALDGLTALGPINVLKLKFRPKQLDRGFVAELWLYPDGSRIFELSTKCMPTEAFQVAAEVRGFMTRKGVNLGGDQQTKTRTALEYFASLRRPAAEAMAPAGA